uniref:At1g61320/AtMIF1 LRR domain-containing protein n=1 Tax=Oryza punctata TaxID=4537 RepID=A0A0E0MPV0_ORYPU
MPMHAAARAACLSHTFLSSWRCYPNLTLTWTTLRPKACAKELSWNIDRILRNHSGIGLKKLELNLGGEYSTFPCVDSWVQVAITPGIEMPDLMLYEKLQAIQCKAPNLSMCDYFGEKIKLSLGQPLRMKKLYLCHSNVVCYARAELPSIMPNLGTLLIGSDAEVVDTPMVPHEVREHESVFGGSSHLRQLPEQPQHKCLKIVEMMGSVLRRAWSS